MRAAAIVLVSVITAWMPVPMTHCCCAQLTSSVSAPFATLEHSTTLPSSPARTATVTFERASEVVEANARPTWFSPLETIQLRI